MSIFKWGERGDDLSAVMPPAQPVAVAEPEVVLRDNISFHAQSRRWPGIGGIQSNWELFG